MGEDDGDGWDRSSLVVANTADDRLTTLFSAPTLPTTGPAVNAQAFLVVNDERANTMAIHIDVFIRITHIGRFRLVPFLVNVSVTGGCAIIVIVVIGDGGVACWSVHPQGRHSHRIPI